MFKIILDDAEMAWAKRVAHHRQDEAVRAQLPDRHGFTGNGYSIHFLGAVGELAVAKLLGLEWEASVNTFKQPDVDGFIQVRTRSEHWHELLVRDNDHDDEIFVHVTAKPPECHIHGFMIGKNAKQARWKCPHGGRQPAYFIPFSDLEKF